MASVVPGHSLNSSPAMLKFPSRKNVRWSPPPESWVKINTDGSYVKSANVGAAGGLIRDHEGNWLCGFTAHLHDVSSSLEAELKGVKIGLVSALSSGFLDVELESDCLAAVEYITLNYRCFHFQDLVDECKELLKKFRNVRVHHVYREGNHCADFLSKFGLRQESKLLYHDFPPKALSYQLAKDAEFLRVIPICRIIPAPQFILIPNVSVVPIAPFIC